jgi:bacterial/archaeal transporter family-2 protein
MSTPTPALAVALTAAVGGAIALQAPINSHLGKSVGTFQAAFLSFAIGTVVLLAIAAVASGGLGGVRHMTNVPWYYLTGGLLGVAYVSTVIVTVRTLGAGGVTAATIAGQLTLAVVVDQFGWLGLAQRSITVSRMAGIVLLAAGVFLVVRS